jgi:hypothetical protein
MKYIYDEGYVIGLLASYLDISPHFRHPSAVLSMFSQRVFRSASLQSRRGIAFPHRTFQTTNFKMGLVSDAVKQDHRELEDYYNRIISSSDQDEQTRYQNLFIWELARHSIGEELVLYPTIEKSVPNGVELVQKDREDHQKVRNITVLLLLASHGDIE